MDLFEIFRRNTIYELKRREEKKREKGLKKAKFPYYKTLDEFKIAEQQSLNTRQLEQLKELTWLE